MAMRKSTPLRAVAALAALLPCASFAQPGYETRVTGSMVFHGAGASAQYIFECSGEPTCTGPGRYVLTGTSPPINWTRFGTMTLNNFALSSGTGGGLAEFTWQEPTLSVVSRSSFPYGFGSSGDTGTFGNMTGLTGSFQVLRSIAAPPPAFPLSVTTTIDDGVANASGQLQVRPQDVGSSGSVFVFAHAPANIVAGATTTKRATTSPPLSALDDDAIVCVLAQVDSSGHLVAVSAANMHAYLTEVLGAQAQAVQILDKVPTANLGGATLYVGYGADAAAMLANGVYQTAVSMPGAVQCTASLTSAPAPQSPAALSGLWWNAGESGWGIHFTQRRGIIFAAWYTYDASGNPKWYVASNCSGVTASSGTCNGALYEVSGPAFFNGAFDTNLVNARPAGNLRVDFRDVDHASMTYTVEAQSRTVAITRQPLGAVTATPAVDYTDLWWNPAESGWGMAMAQRSGNIFLAWYVYDGEGQPTWYVASGCTLAGSSCTGSLYRTTGPDFGPAFDPARVHVFEVGSAVVSFLDANNAVLSYTVDGVTATKIITRQVF